MPPYLLIYFRGPRRWLNEKGGARDRGNTPWGERELERERERERGKTSLSVSVRSASKLNHDYGMMGAWLGPR